MGVGSGYETTFGISYPFYSTERPYTSTVTQLAGEENAKVTFTTTSQDLRVSHDRHSISGLVARDYMYHDERIQGGVFTPVLVVTDRSVFVELEVMNRSILFEHATCMIYLLSI